MRETLRFARSRDVTPRAGHSLPDGFPWPAHQRPSPVIPPKRPEMPVSLVPFLVQTPGDGLRGRVRGERDDAQAASHDRGDEDRSLPGARAIGLPPSRIW